MKRIYLNIRAWVLFYIPSIPQIKKLLHHKDTTCGLYAFDKNPGYLLRDFYKLNPDYLANMNATDRIKKEKEFYDYVEKLTFIIKY